MQIPNSISSVLKPEAQAGTKYKRDFFKQQFYEGKNSWDSVFTLGLSQSQRSLVPKADEELEFQFYS